MQPQFGLSHFLLGRAYVETREPGRAVEAYSSAMKLNPSSSTLSYDGRTEAYELLGEQSLAVKDYGRAIKLSPEPSRYARRGVTLFTLNRLDEAIKDFDRAIELYDTMFKGLAKSQGKLDEAAQITPILAMTYNNRGSSYHEAGQIKLAIDDYTEAIRLNPNMGAAFYNRATAFALLGKNSEAKRDLLRAEALGTAIPN